MVEISNISTEYTIADDPHLPHEWRYNKNIPRISFRFQVQHTHTPVLKRAQKKKASSSVKQTCDPLFYHFLYTRFTVDQIAQLFSVYHITLGDNEQDRQCIISAIQTMDRVAFEHMLSTLGYQGANNTQCTHIHPHHVLGHIATVHTTDSIRVVDSVP